MKKQTAITWLVKNLFKNEFLGVYCTEKEKKSKIKQIDNLIKKAKKIEKKQLFDAMDYGVYAGMPCTDESCGPEKYYNKTFKNK